MTGRLTDGTPLHRVRKILNRHRMECIFKDYSRQLRPVRSLVLVPGGLLIFFGLPVLVEGNGYWICRGLFQCVVHRNDTKKRASGTKMKWSVQV